MILTCKECKDVFETEAQNLNPNEGPLCPDCLEAFYQGEDPFKDPSQA